MGPAGPAGPAAVVSNDWSAATRTINSGDTIADSDTHLYFVVNNSSGPVSITMPHANVRGKLIEVVGTSKANTITVNRQGTDVIDSTYAAGGTNATTDCFVGLLSEGNGRWKVVYQ